jgi:hypothetical protein
MFWNTTPVRDERSTTLTVWSDTHGKTDDEMFSVARAMRPLGILTVRLLSFGP